MPAPPPRRILVILLVETGDIVLAEPMFRRIRDRYPAAEIHVTVLDHERETLDALRVARPDHVLSIRDDSLGNFLGDVWATIRRVRELRFDAVVDCGPFSRVSAVLSGASGARTMVGFHRHTQEGLYRGSFMTAPVPYNPHRHITHQFVTLADAIESLTRPRGKDGSPRETYAPPTFELVPREFETDISALHRDHPAIEGRSLVLMYPSGGSLPIRAWPLEHYATVARELLADGSAIGILGMPDDRRLAERLQQACGDHPNLVNLAGSTPSVRHLMTLFHRASLLISNDGGPGHLAAMTPLRTIVLFGPDAPALRASWSPNAHAFHTRLSCSPCLTAFNHGSSPCDGDNQCLKRIQPGDVLIKARELMRTASPLGVGSRSGS